MDDRASDALVCQELGIFPGQDEQLARDECAVFQGEHFPTLFADLRGVEAHPQSVNLWAAAPERHVFFEVARARKHLVRDGPVNVDLAAFDVFEDALVGGGLAANVVMLWETVNGDGNAETWDLHPFGRDGDDSAGDNEREDVERAEGGENTTELAMADQGFAAHQGNVDRLVFANESQDTIDKRVTPQIIQLAQRDTVAQMQFPIGVAAGAREGALAGYFDGEQRDATSEDAAPSGKDFARSKARVGSMSRHNGRHIEV